jgi:FHS family L-fucose permease-like MFS transporter
MFRHASGANFLLPFILIALLYLLWGCAHGLLDVLNKQFQLTFDMSKGQSGFIQFILYIAYFIMAVPAGLILRRMGYKRGIISGLLIFALGAFAFIPAAFLHTPIAFLVALFIIGCGLTIIETGAHPYATSLGPEKSAAQRINIAAAFNGVGWIVGPLIGGALIFGADAGDQMAMAKPYIFVGAAVLLVCIFLSFMKLPEITPESDEPTVIDEAAARTSIWSHKHLKWAIIAQFLYVGAQTGIGSFFINYVTELDPSISDLTASRLLGFGGMGLFFVGRLLSGIIMKWFRPAGLLAGFGVLGAICMALVMMSLGRVSLYALYLSFFFMSMMFPTIFALGVRGLGPHTKKASSYLVMCIVGGAVFPLLMGYIGKTSIALGFVLPLIAFAFIGGFAWSQRKK